MSASLPCQVQDRCGGCPWMPHALEEQRDRKILRVERSLGRPADAVHASPSALGYRARITLRPGPNGQWAYSPPRSHQRVEVSTCPIARPELSEALAVLPPVPGARSVELRSDGQKVVLAFDGGQRTALDALAGPWKGVARGNQVIQGDVTTRLDVESLRLGYGPRTFYQVNLEVNEVLVRRVREEVLALAPEAVLELYSGAGNLTFPLAAQGLAITAVESHPGAVSDARRTAADLGLSPTLLQANADKVELGAHPFDVLVLDPPRAGAPGVIGELIPGRPRGIVYVSCNAGALARDLRPALAAGYRIHRLELFDMFPQTPHAEVLCVLHRP